MLQLHLLFFLNRNVICKEAKCLDSNLQNLKVARPCSTSTVRVHHTAALNRFTYRSCPLSPVHSTMWNYYRSVRPFLSLCLSPVVFASAACPPARQPASPSVWCLRSAALASVSTALQTRDAPLLPSLRACHSGSSSGLPSACFLTKIQTQRRILGSRREGSDSFPVLPCVEKRGVNGRGTTWSSCAAAQAGVRSTEPEKGQQIYEMGWCKWDWCSFFPLLLCYLSTLCHHAYVLVQQ